jgi:hypothetical protein
LLAAILLVACSETTVIERETVSDEPRGRVIMTITDDLVDLRGISSLRITIDNVQVYSEEDGWITVGGDEETYDLLQLRDVEAVIADQALEAETYTAMRMDLSSVEVVDSRGTHNAELPAEKYTINAQLIIEPEGLSAVTFDFIPERSLHIAEDGTYVFAPVVRVTSRTDAVVQPVRGDTVIVTGGNIVADVTYGMTLQGAVDVNVIVPDRPIIIDNGVIRVERTIQDTTTYNTTVYNTTTVVNRRNVINEDVTQNNTYDNRTLRSRVNVTNET